MADGKDNFDELQKAAPPDASAALIQDTHVGMPAKVGDNTAAPAEKTIAAAPDYSGEGAAVQGRMNVTPEEGLRVANENITNLTASMSNSPEGAAMAKQALKDAIDFHAQRNPEITKHVGN